jgi:phage baseplate assembly protein W
MFDLLLATKNTGIPPLGFAGNTQPFIFMEATNDLQLSPTNDLAVLDGTSRLAQDIQKILITARGTNILLPIYGTNLQSLIGSKLEFAFLQGQIVSEITDAMIILQALNQNNPDLDQQIATLQSVSVDLSSSTQIGIQLTVITVSQKQVGAIVTVVP